MKKLDILFVHPNSSSSVYQGLSENYSAIEPPIWAGMLANHCREKGFHCEIIDCESLHIGPFIACQAIIKQKPRVVCFVVYGQQPSASTQNMQGATELSKELRANWPDSKICFVGGHVAALPKETMMKHPEIDFVCQNEGVYTLSELLKVDNLNDMSALQKVKGLGWRMDMVEGEHDIIMNMPSHIVPKEKLSTDLPGVAWDLLDLRRYRTALWHSYPNNCDRSNFASIYTSLGCPFSCSFCMINIINRQENEYSDGSNIFRFWEPEFTIKQLDKLWCLGIRNLKIADEMFVLNKNHFLKICEMIIERGYKFNIWCYARVDTIKDEYLEVLKKAGVNYLGIGIESAASKVRRDVIKGKFEEVDIRSIVKKVRSHGINVAANYIFGLPEETHETMKETLDLALELNTEMANFYCAMAYPGSPLYKIAKENSWKLPDTYSGYSQHSYDCQPLPSKYLKAEEILAFRDSAWNQYHTNPNFLAMIREKFGERAVEEIKRSTQVTLKRKLYDTVQC
jgi:radical SAM superfamily enzyme YgiQ (UPF0313 family)